MQKLASRICRECTLITVLCAVLVAAIWIVTVERVSYERTEAIKAAQRSNSNLALAVEEQTVRTLKQAEQALLFMKYEYHDDGKVIGVQQLVEEGVLADGGFVLSFIVDRDGYVLLGDGKRGKINLADRPFFTYHRDHADARTRLERPLTGRISGRPVIALSRRATAADGSFDGTYVVGIDPNHFLTAYERFDLGKEGLVQLVGLDGISRARRASGKLTFGDDMRSSSIVKYAAAAASGSFLSAGKREGVLRFSSFRRIDEYGLVVGVGTSVKETLAEFVDRERVYHGSAVAATLVLAAFAAALMVTIRRRQRAAGALASSEALYRTAFEQAAVGVAHVGLDGAFLKVNRKWCEMLGYTEEELLARKFADVTHPDDLARSDAAVKSVLGTKSGGGEQTFEKRYLRKDGAVLHATVAPAAVRASDGKPEYFVSMIQDITLRKATEARLLEQLDELRRFQKVTVDRELRMLEIEAQIRVLKEKAAA